jgi:hypothetical protein
MPYESHKDIFVCTSCFKRATRREIELRKFNTGYCDYCGMNLVPLENLRTKQKNISMRLRSVIRRSLGNI